MPIENEFSSAFSAAFDMEGERACIVVDWSCIPDEDLLELDPDIKLRAELFAQAAIRVLTGGQVGNCPVTVRPCVSGCAPASPIMNPEIRDGRWYNTCGCPAERCSCSALTKIILKGPVGGIAGVYVDGSPVSPSYYRVDNGNELIRLGGPEWPTRQDMTLPDTEVGTMAVTYYQGAVLDKTGEFVAGILAKEFLDACEGRECRLPFGVESLSRQGVNLDFSGGLFPGNRTGIEEVDIWVAAWNPYAQKSPSMVFSPDELGDRRVTWWG